MKVNSLFQGFARIVGYINTIHDKGVILHSCIKRRVKYGGLTKF